MIGLEHPMPSIINHAKFSYTSSTLGYQTEGYLSPILAHLASGRNSLGIQNHMASGQIHWFTQQASKIAVLPRSLSIIQTVVCWKRAKKQVARRIQRIYENTLLNQPHILLQAIKKFNMVPLCLVCAVALFFVG